ncbi:MAG: protein kinase [bacterium]|nr:protein kinase [bacterium]
MTIQIQDPTTDGAVVKTLLVSDLVSSTRLVEQLGDRRAAKVFARHDRLARSLLEVHRGREIDKTDGFLLLFERPIYAVRYALAYHHALTKLSEELGVSLVSRVGVHLGEVILRVNKPEDVARGAKPIEVEGLAKPMAARLMSLAQGRQTLLTRGAYDVARRGAADNVAAGQLHWLAHGAYLFKGVREPIEIFEVGEEGTAPLAAPRDSDKVHRVGDESALATRLAPAVRNPFFHRQAIADSTCFFGRGNLVRGLLEMVASGQSCALVGERRMGKSSLLGYLAEVRVLQAHALNPRKTLAVMLDFLAFQTYTPEDLWLEILEMLELVAEDEEARRILGTAARLEEVSFAAFRRALRKLKRQGFRVVLLCDEFELAVQNPNFDLSFFGALRSLAGSEGVVFVTASRLSLLELEQYRGEEVREKVLGSPFFNIFAEFRVGPFEDYEVAELLAGSLDASTIRFDPEGVRFLDRVAGRHPYFLQLTAYHLYAALESAGAGRASTGGEELLAGARNRVGEEAAKIFRNQWHHSGGAERRALAALTVAERKRDDVEMPPVGAAGALGARIVVRLERRGLVRTLEAAKPESRRRVRLFSDLLSEWIQANVTATLEIAPAGDGVTGDTQAPRSRQSRSPAAAESPGGERYTILEEIGRGGAGTVFKAWDGRLERVVALKVLDEHIRASPGTLKRLLHEARTCAGLHHPHIVVVHDIDVEQGVLVQEFLAGGSLRDLLEVSPVLPVADVLSLAEQLADALGAAHQAGVIHRDLKPENVLLTQRPPARSVEAATPIMPDVKLADFGTALRLADLSQVPERSSIAGTLAYMAPEQLAGGAAGPAADFFTLGVVLFESRHGQRPAPVGEGDESVPEPIGFDGGEPTGLDVIIARCLEPSAKTRFQVADELSAELAAARKEGSAVSH